MAINRSLVTLISRGSFCLTVRLEATSRRGKKVESILVGFFFSKKFGSEWKIND